MDAAPAAARWTQRDHGVVDLHRRVRRLAVDVGRVRGGVVRGAEGARVVERRRGHAERLEDARAHGLVVRCAELAAGIEHVPADEAGRAGEEIRVLKHLAEFARRLHRRERLESAFGRDARRTRRTGRAHRHARGAAARRQFRAGGCPGRAGEEPAAQGRPPHRSQIAYAAKAETHRFPDR